MSVWQSASTSVPPLAGSDGELISIRIAIEPRALEDLLDCLAALPFPVNPEIHHGVPTVVEFPAWETCLHRVTDALRSSGFDPASVHVEAMLSAITAAA